ncbi:alpha/beta fold hydrolase [[Mycobacterium] wendilense]|uniref:Alpha/beta hydrolase n=1 Tax=[Mycobacterium] wendilense TaxID=3064284 RepID=A0ABM9MKM7_9MYCO|nr:alpha/beta fold hydrolase [Mycolicibacterium sp. MU0050]CAJ1587541.1 alpha/beta hydrolase [Mycolicibacterium sp. MU0050]
MREVQVPDGPATEPDAAGPQQEVAAPTPSVPEIAEVEQVSPEDPAAAPPADATSADLRSRIQGAEARARELVTALVSQGTESERPRAATVDTETRAAAAVGPDAPSRVEASLDAVRSAADAVLERAANTTAGEVESTAPEDLSDDAGQRSFLASGNQVQIAATGIRATAIGVAGSLRQGLDTLRHPHPAGPVNVIGSVVFSLLGAALQTLSGPPVLPPNSTVAVRTSTLALSESGKTVRADWYFPDEIDEETRLIYLQHGFMATGPMYSYTAAHLAESTNSIVVAPSLSSNLFVPDAHWIGGGPLQQDVAALFRDDRTELAASAAEAGYVGVLPDEYVLVGHSLGGTLVMGAAEKMDDATIRNLRGVVLLDAVDADNAVPEGLARLRGDNFRPVLNISSERYTWNLDGIVADQLQQARPDSFNGVMLIGGRHIDALQGGNPILQIAEYLIAGFSTPENIDAVKVLAGEWINDMFDGVTPSYDPAGPGTATPLSSASEETLIVMPWDPIAKVILDVLFRFAVFQPLAAAADGVWADSTSTAV